MHPINQCPTLLIYGTFFLQEKEGQCLPVIRKYNAIFSISGSNCLVFCKYSSMKMFGANWTMFCSPQPKGISSSWPKFWSAGPMISPKIWVGGDRERKAQAFSNMNWGDSCLLQTLLESWKRASSSLNWSNSYHIQISSNPSWITPAQQGKTGSFWKKAARDIRGDTLCLPLQPPRDHPFHIERNYCWKRLLDTHSWG